ncbi:MAG: hypothetical protein HZA59_08235 [Hydrogenophilales bacterium]|nr:hypothetical protein [Hydrogenophilales bacterium]
MKFLRALFWAFWFGSTLAFAAPESKSILVAPNVEIPVTRYSAGKQSLILWLPSEIGVVQAEHDTAVKLARRGYSVWVADLFGARFLPVAPSSLDEIPAADVAGLIQAAAQKHRKIILLSSGRGAAIALGGAQQWQAQHPAQSIAGAVLLFPNLLTGSPEAGEEAAYLPITRQTHLPIAILQGDKSPWHWQLDALKQQLEQGGSRVAIKTLPGMRDRFYFRENALPRERELGDRLDALIDDAIKSLPALKRKSP